MLPVVGFISIVILILVISRPVIYSLVSVETFTWVAWYMHGDHMMSYIRNMNKMQLLPSTIYLYSKMSLGVLWLVIVLQSVFIFVVQRTW